MEVWILFNEEIEAPSAEAFEVRRFLSEGKEMGLDIRASMKHYSAFLISF